MGDAIETGRDIEHVLLRVGIGYRLAEGTDLLGMTEPELRVIQGRLHFDCYSRLDQPAFNRND